MSPVQRGQHARSPGGGGEPDDKVRQLIAWMRTLAFLASLRRRIQSRDVLVQTQPEKGKVTEKTDFSPSNVSGNWK